MSFMATPLAAMSSKHHDSAAVQRVAATPQRPNHHLRRSITEQSAPFRQSLVHQYLHRKDRDRDERLPVSAGPPLRGSLDLPCDANTGMTFWPGDNAPNAGEGANPAQQLPNKDGLSQEQKDRVAAATASLQNLLAELNASSTAAVARLDEAYASVLRRLGSLRSTIVAMKELAAMSQEISERFTSESRSLVNEIESQLSIYDQSEDQRKRIQDLQIRIHAGRDKVQALSKRVDVMRERIEDWERADQEWQERTRKRLKVISTIFVIAFGLLFLFFGAKYAPSSVDVNGIAESPPGGPVQRSSMETIVGNNSKNAATMADDVREELTRRRAHNSPVKQEVLRAFDEL
ncbi:hypothetical protein F4861DRAFT_310962 [Xylaria intraflava]|nr:hypothetical protein F4861DRAFT_310962 [Xylaria intraflava]